VVSCGDVDCSYTIVYVATAAVTPILHIDPNFGATVDNWDTLVPVCPH
jgi:hypothetical protein